jgi:hypothetical protein
MLTHFSTPTTQGTFFVIQASFGRLVCQSSAEASHATTTERGHIGGQDNGVVDRDDTEWGFEAHKASITVRKRKGVIDHTNGGPSKRRRIGSLSDSYNYGENHEVGSIERDGLSEISFSVESDEEDEIEVEESEDDEPVPWPGRKMQKRRPVD